MNKKSQVITLLKAKNIYCCFQWLVSPWSLKFISNDKNELYLWWHAKPALQVPLLVYCVEGNFRSSIFMSVLIALNIHCGHSLLIKAAISFTNLLWNSWPDFSWQILQYHAEYISRDIFTGFKTRIVLNIFKFPHSSQMAGNRILLNLWRLLERHVVLRPNQIILQGNRTY